ncbi:MAG: sigma-54-dependent Fis family transcriptional regulator [Polyangia bacterium]
MLRTEQPVIVSDACKDAEFQNAQSVMHLRLTSVMCVPLRERGQLLGALYVGTSDVRRLFRSADLESLTVIAAQAGLLLRNAHLLSELRRDNQRLGVELEQMRSQAIASAGIGLGASQVMQDVMRTVAKVAQSDVSVLITGETGTGKELVAQEIHRRSPRAKGPFVALNCGAIPEQLLESELFGHVRGAFTGAVANKPGRIQAAQGGSIFLDEIGEMPMPLQVKLLRVLQERVIVRVGDTRPEPVDVRVLSATHRDLPTEIRTGRFREDLFYRLNVVQVQLPPLRERGDDVLLLARSFLRRFADELKLPQRTLSVASELAIRHFAWPGNVRQLENHIKKALVMADRGELEPEDLGLVAPSQNEIIPLADAKDRFARQYVLDALAQCGGNRTRAAQLLGVDPRTVFRFLEREDPVKADS